MKVSVAGTSLKESEKKDNESLCRKNNSQQAEESRDCKFRTNSQCHRRQRYKFNTLLTLIEDITWPREDTNFIFEC